LVRVEDIGLTILRDGLVQVSKPKVRIRGAG
jgi:hypothetical protein